MKLWIRIDSDYPRDPRVGRLAAELRIPLHEALGKVLIVHCSMADHAPDGDLSEIPDETINGWVGWPVRTSRRAPATTFARAFRRFFLDKDGVDESYAYGQAKLYDRAEKQRERTRLWREKKKLETQTVTPESESQNANSMHTVTPEYAPTERNGTERPEKNKLTRAADAAPERFDEFWTLYPRRSGSNPKKAALAQWRLRVREGSTADEMITGAQRYRELMEATDKIGTEFVMQAVRFLGRDKHFEDELTLPPAESNGDQRPHRATGEGRAFPASERMVW